jgi:hypothetical protein
VGRSDSSLSMTIVAGRSINEAVALKASFKGDLVVSQPGEEVVLAFGKQFKLRQADRSAGLLVRKLHKGLCEEAVAISDRSGRNALPWGGLWHSANRVAKRPQDRRGWRAWQESDSLLWPPEPMRSTKS